MQEVSREQIVEALQAVGINPGDGLLVHSAIHFLGRPAGGVAMYYQALWAVLEGRTPVEGESGRFPKNASHPMVKGTLAVPTFNFDFAEGQPYDPQNTPSKGMGVFSEYVRELPQSHRTSHPMQSLAVVGRHAEDLAGRDTPSAFDPGSAFERMLELDFKLVLLGADVQAVSLLHYSEQRARVPYRYWKEFSGRVRTPAGWEQRTYRMFVRDRDLDPHIELYQVEETLKTRGQWSQVEVNYGQISACRLGDFVTAVDQFLARDSWSLVVNKPQ
jgi:aminoglycoside 3-N-acetyltransferase